MQGFLIGVTVALACWSGTTASADLPAWASVYLAEEHSAEAETALRAAGQPGLDAVLDVATEQDRLGDPVVRLKIDRLAGQRDAWASGLYWHRDFASARAEAETSGRPILSLRLLGNLDDDLSCANSRFFRTALYANENLSAYIKDRFVLHWQSVRPVPVMTIDFGDGRTLRRTITGNSFHYVLDPRGRVVDVIPGLYGPHAFQSLLERAEAWATSSRLLGPDEYRQAIGEFHRTAIDQMALNESMWLIPLSSDDPASPAAELLVDTAWNADALTVGKSFVESSSLRALRPVAARDLPDADPAWDRLAELYRPDNALDASSRELFFEKERAGEQANQLTAAKRRTEDPAFAALRRFEDSLARDTAMNEHRLHRRFHEYVLADGAIDDLEALTGYVYAELFLAPLDDPWYGLNPADAYPALDRRGEWAE